MKYLTKQNILDAVYLALATIAFFGGLYAICWIDAVINGTL